MANEKIQCSDYEWYEYIFLIADCFNKYKTKRLFFYKLSLITRTFCQGKIPYITKMYCKHPRTLAKVHLSLPMQTRVCRNPCKKISSNR